MLRIAGAVDRSFVFPAELEVACKYYSQLNRVFTWLPHISPVKAYSAEDYRMLYHTTELGVYQVRIYCDLRAKFDDKKRMLNVQPLTQYQPVKEHASLTSLTAQGRYTSTSTFQAEGKQTRINYHLELGAVLPKPRGLGLVPDAVIEKVALEITHWRIYEIADGFIERSIREYRRTHR